MAGKNWRSESGFSDVVGGLRLFAKQADEAQTRVRVAVALVIVGALKIKLSQPGKGRWYLKRKSKSTKTRKGHPGIWHRASKPGDPPAPDTGALRNSVGYEVLPDMVKVGTNMDYAEALEFGTIKMEPRPFLRPVINQIRAQMTGAAISVLRTAATVK